MRRSLYFIYFLCSFLLAILLADLLLGGKNYLIGMLLVLVFLILKRCHVNYLALFLILFGLVFGLWRFDVSLKNLDFDQGYQSVEGCVVGEVDVRADRTKYTLMVERLGMILVNADRYPLYQYGDCLSVTGMLTRPQKIDDFDYDKYLARYNIYALMSGVRIERISEAGFSFLGLLFKFKNVFSGALETLFAEPHNSFMAGLILGSRRGIPEHLMKDFNTTGLTHIIAISGYNITLVIIFVAALFSFLSRKKKVVVSILFIAVFVLLVGASAAVVRAGIMGAISLLAVWFGREYRVEIALLLAAFLMALWNPKIIVYDVGFQLSFLATMGLIFVSPKIEKFFLFLPESFGIRESVLMTMSAQVLALPVIIYNFGRLSLISPIANLFVLPFIPMAMVFGFVAALLSLLSKGLALLLAFGGYLVLEMMIYLVKFFAEIPLASIDISWFKSWMLLLYYYFLERKIFGDVEAK